MNFNFDLNLYKVFYMVAKNNSFSKAAEELLVTQPSVSYSIKQLEERLEIKLFQRNHKGIKITSEGKEVLKYVEKSYKDITVGEKALYENRNLKSGKISIGVQSHIGRFFLFPYLEKFHKKYPKIEMNISSRNTAELIKLLEDNDIDFVIDTSPIETKYNNIITEPLMELEHCFVVSSTYKIERKTLQIQELKNYSLILPVERSTQRKQLVKELRKKDIELIPFMTIETTEMLIDAVKKNMGIGYVMKKAVENELKNGELYEIKVDIELPKLLLNLVYIENDLTYIPNFFIKEIKEKYL